MKRRKSPIFDPDGRLAERAAAIKADFFENRWQRYMEMVRWLEDHPENREGADKIWVLESTEAYRAMYRNAVRVR